MVPQHEDRLKNALDWSLPRWTCYTPELNSQPSTCLADSTLIQSDSPVCGPLICPSIFFYLAECSLLFYVLVHRNVSQALLITAGTARLLTDCCRLLRWSDSGLLSEAAARSSVLCLAECAHCGPAQHTPSTLYFPVRDLLHPSSLCPLFLRLRGSDGKVEGRAEVWEQKCQCCYD